MSQTFDEEIFQIYLEEGRQSLDDLETRLLALEAGTLAGPDLQENLDAMFRSAHNFKGASASVGLEQPTQVAHAIEDLLTVIKYGHIAADRSRCSIILKAIDIVRTILTEIPKNPGFQLDVLPITTQLRSAILDQAGNTPLNPTAPQMQAPVNKPEPTGIPTSKKTEETSIRVHTHKLDGLLDLVGELVVNQSMMISHRVNGTTASDHAVQTLSYIEKIVLELQSVAMTLRMVPIKPLFQKMNRIVRDVASQLGKEVEFETDGDHVELDKIVLERVTDPLTHLVRNAIDHGLEDPSDRSRTGKSACGRVRLSAVQKDDTILILIQDDGKGLDADVLRRKAVQKGLIREGDASALTEEEAWNLIFLPGFSTKESISDISGRGVGMDVVMKAVNELKGSIRIQSSKGAGTTFEIALPLSLSIIPGLIVQVDQENYVIPVSQLVEIIELQKFDIHSTTQKGNMINLRGEVIPVHPLGGLLSGARPKKQAGAAQEKKTYRPAIISRRRGRKIACEVDAVLGQQQIVIKQLGTEIQKIPGIMGGAVLSDGEPSMILDLAEIPLQEEIHGSTKAS